MKHPAHPLALDVGEVTVIARTARALRVRFDVDGAAPWIPLSQLDRESEVYEVGDHGILIISEWLARKLGRVDECGYTVLSALP